MWKFQKIVCEWHFPWLPVEGVTVVRGQFFVLRTDPPTYLRTELVIMNADEAVDDILV